MSIASWIPIIGDLIDTIKKVVPDRAAQDELIGKINQTLADAAARQSEITRDEVNSEDKFKSRWRPGLGWVCVAGLGMHLLLFPCVSLAVQLFGGPYVTSPLDAAALLSLVGTLLGLGGLRTVEKIKGTQ